MNNHINVMVDAKDSEALVRMKIYTGLSLSEILRRMIKRSSNEDGFNEIVPCCSGQYRQVIGS